MCNNLNFYRNKILQIKSSLHSDINAYTYCFMKMVGKQIL